MSICGICKCEKPSGLMFHATDDWLHTRLFICDSCMKDLAMQKSLHELCYECSEHLSMQELADTSKARFIALDNAIRNFEKSHSTMFEQLPVSVDPDCVHPGSIHPNLKKLRNNFMPHHRNEKGNDSQKLQGAGLMDCQKLTKKFLMKLPVGLYIVSNCGERVKNTYKPIFEEQVAKLEERQKQWERIKQVYADGRLCNIYACAEDYQNHKKTRPN
ncbi:hypothetical protein ACFL3G_06125 [Planctomycetota bacterium]